MFVTVMSCWQCGFRYFWHDQQGTNEGVSWIVLACVPLNSDFLRCLTLFFCIHSFIHSFISIQPLGQFSRNQNPVRRPVWLWHTASWGKFLGVGCHCFPPPLDVPTFSARCLHVQRRERPLAAEGGTLRGREMFRKISSRIRLPCNSRDLLHAANLRHGTDGFTSPPKEGVLRIFFALKNPAASAGFEPMNLGTKGQHATSRPPKPIFGIFVNKHLLTVYYNVRHNLRCYTLDQCFYF